MLQIEGKTDVRAAVEGRDSSCDGLSRRDFLRVGALSAGAVGLSLAEVQALGKDTRENVNCILLFLVGGPGHLDTWDPKPLAPDTVRGPFRPIQTNVPGIQICEHFPKMARLADRYTLIRSVHHDAPPIHETGQQLMQTGRLSRGNTEFPHYGSVLSHAHGPRQPGVPPFVVLPRPIGNTGVSVSHGQGAGLLGPQHEPFVLSAEPETLLGKVNQAHRLLDAQASTTLPVFSPTARNAFDLTREKNQLRQRYGDNTFGQSVLLARRLVEAGVRLVTVNMFDTVFNEITWDCHAEGNTLPATLDDYKTTLCPMFDRAYATLLEDLAQRGLLETTLVLAMGEFGRTPQINPRGGRDHWPGCWTVLFAGGGVQGGQVIGASDSLGAEPRDRPVTPAEIAATVYHALGIDPTLQVPGQPIHELLGTI